MKYKIWATSSGYHFGPRSAWMKEDGVIYETDSRQEAEAMAKKVTEQMNGENSLCCYTYTVREG